MRLLLLIFLILILALLAMSLFLQMRDRRDARTRVDTIRSKATVNGPAPLHDPQMVADLPPPVAAYFNFMITPGTPLTTSIELTMEGELSLGTKAAPNYRPMTAHQTLALPHGLLWAPKLPGLYGSDSAAPDRSWTRFWLFGLVPVARAGGTEDHLRSAFGRLVAESAMWAPAGLLPQIAEAHGGAITWRAEGDNRINAVYRFGSLTQSLTITLTDTGEPVEVVIDRWSNENPDKIFQWQPFGGIVSEFETHNGFQIPMRVEAGNWFGTDAYYPFFKARLQTVSIPG